MTTSHSAAHCELCGSTDYEDLHTGDQGYTACCNEPVCYGPCDHVVQAAAHVAARRTPGLTDVQKRRLGLR